MIMLMLIFSLRKQGLDTSLLELAWVSRCASVVQGTFTVDRDSMKRRDLGSLTHRQNLRRFKMTAELANVFEVSKG